MSEAAAVALLLDLARFLLAEGRGELLAHLARYWRSRDLGPIPPPLDRWAAIDAEHDRAVAKMKAFAEDEHD